MHLKCHNLQFFYLSNFEIVPDQADKHVFFYAMSWTKKKFIVQKSGMPAFVLTQIK